MLLHLAHALVTPAPLAHRRLGLVGDSLRTGARARRCRAAWAPHLAATRAAIEASIEAGPGRGTVVVLGSGHLDDVPLARLAAAFRRVVLVDAVHPWRSRWATRAHPNVEHLSADLGGAVRWWREGTGTIAPTLPSVCTETGTDLVISANLLSQLPIRPVERLERSRRGVGGVSPDEGDALGRAIVAGHLSALAGVTARVCLVTDLDEIEEDRAGRTIGRQDLLYGVALLAPERTWLWDIAPFGEIGRDRRLIHRVAAFPDWHDRNGTN